MVLWYVHYRRLRFEDRAKRAGPSKEKESWRGKHRTELQKMRITVRDLAKTVATKQKKEIALTVRPKASHLAIEVTVLLCSLGDCVQRCPKAIHSSRSEDTAAVDDRSNS